MDLNMEQKAWIQAQFRDFIWSCLDLAYHQGRMLQHQIEQGMPRTMAAQIMRQHTIDMHERLGAFN